MLMSALEKLNITVTIFFLVAIVVGEIGTGMREEFTDTNRKLDIYINISMESLVK
jgi:hypothetical protein